MAKVLVGLSGGVDSAVAALLLKEQGHDVIGITLRTWESESGEMSRCCEIDDARDTAALIGIPFHVVNCVSSFCENVTAPFVAEYLRGRTPNPCVGCNRTVKWAKMLEYADILQAAAVATGHYANVVQLPDGRYTVRTADHAEKDQTYMLYRLTQDQLARTMMPLGSYSKETVRELARQAGIVVADKPDSQEICFVPEGHYAEYVRDHAPEGSEIPGEGNFVDTEGRVLGRHKGIINYTVGQRKGLGIALGFPAYVTEIRPSENEVVLGDESAVYRDSILCEDVNFMGVEDIPEGESLRSFVKVRYHHAPQAAVVTRMGDGLFRIDFDEPVRAAAPGQSAVWYDENGCVLGGGVISNM
ncbi:MAG: tRNA 2-thiouridine(34) synthase MnmA [Lachnospiraceae bacterium]|nr:tRNA 2-thiouridine(34) synthase MnmA [Lachnospiraceae bacterium]